ncbi:hypothetical protein B0H16DRAFT_1710797 [Mycena metata]|uniref:Uncharacterized protein n=1 Tax=Mycena metata TaxID=1033252 RepID=A0AAD7KAA2_9AGAR|nr:hypothetical protein B0H16DRAFT_1710797 [Mycena metata]
MISSQALNETNPNAVNIVHGTEAELVLFLVLNMWPSHFGLPILLAIILLSNKVHRHPTFVNLCFGFIIIGCSSSVLLYAGKISGPEPSKMLCLFQASMLYGVPAFAPLLALMLVLQMFLVVRDAVNKRVSQGPHTIRLWAMLIAPYVALLISILATAIVGASNPDDVSRNRRYFYLLLGAVFLFATVVLEIWTLVMLYKNWRSTRHPGGVGVELSLPIRVMAFGLLSLLSVNAPNSPVPDLVIACAATVTILIFGTQPDIIRASLFLAQGIAACFQPARVNDQRQNI